MKPSEAEAGEEVGEESAAATEEEAVSGEAPVEPAAEAEAEGEQRPTKASAEV
jgi:hypothetical protein